MFYTVVTNKLLENGADLFFTVDLVAFFTPFIVLDMRNGFHTKATGQRSIV